MIEHTIRNMHSMVNKGLGFTVEIEDMSDTKHAILSITLVIPSNPVRWDVFVADHPDISSDDSTASQKEWEGNGVWVKNKNGFPFPRMIVVAESVTPEIISEAMTRLTNAPTQIVVASPPKVMVGV